MDIFATLDDCGVSNPGELEFAFKYPITLKFITVPPGMPIVDSPTWYQSVMPLIYNDVSGTDYSRLRPASDMGILFRSPFIIDSTEFVAYDESGNMIPNHVPNWFNPEIWINGINLFETGGSKSGGLGGVGLALPYCRSVKAPFKPLNQDIEVIAQVRRDIGGGDIRNYPLVALLNIKYSKQ